MAKQHALAVALLGTLACLWAAGPALTAPKVSVKTVHYTVRGTTPQEILVYMLRHGPSVQSGPELATASFDIEHDGEVRQIGKRCHLHGYRAKLKIVLHLPKLAKGQKLSPATRKRWTKLSGYIRRHENKHKDIFVQCGRRIESRIKALSGKHSCSVLRDKMQAALVAEYDRCNKLQADFDAREAKRIPNLPLIKQAAKAARSQPAKSSRRRASSTSGGQNNVRAIELSTR
ncbi:MAG: DUF922 domain-containing protein [Hyphomicrobiales bacterium]